MGEGGGGRGGGLYLNLKVDIFHKSFEALHWLSIIIALVCGGNIMWFESI